jgi:hypothetical protein
MAKRTSRSPEVCDTGVPVNFEGKVISKGEERRREEKRGEERRREEKGIAK